MGGRWGRVCGGCQGRGTEVPVTGLKGRSRHGAQKGLEGSVRGRASTVEVVTWRNFGGKTNLGWDLWRQKLKPLQLCGQAT